MRQAIYGFILYIFLMLPPVITLSESIMVVHMHMQMPLLIIIGMLFTPFIKEKFPKLLNWNENGVPGIVLFIIIMIYWLIPRTMDEALTITAVEVFKFISLPFLAGVPLRDSWRKISVQWKNTVFISFIILFGLMGWLYTTSPAQLCNNYLVAEQKALGISFIISAICILIYFVQSLFIKDYNGQS